MSRPSGEESNADKFAVVRAALAEKKGIRRIARELQTGVGTVLRINWRPDLSGHSTKNDVKPM